MTIAVITPAYQAESTLDAALASVAVQTLAPDEVVIADDGSTDRTADIARQWEARLPVRVVRTGGNRGPAAARAVAIAASTSDLIALLDADDVFLADHLELMRAAHATTDDGLASADTLRWIPGRTISDKPLSAMAPVPPRAQQLGWLLQANHLSVASLFSRRRYDSVGGFRAEFHGTEDWDLWIRMVRSGAVVVRPDRPTLLYRLSQGNVSSEDRLVQAKIQVLDAAAREGGTDEQRAINAGRRRLCAAAKLNDAYARAAAGASWSARVAGVKALRGTRRVAVRGAAMAVAPRYVSRRREACRYDTDVWLQRYGS
ncbi:MAG: hypothetical protein QOJ00_2844 [Actinomycetota bacterium]